MAILIGLWVFAGLFGAIAGWAAAKKQWDFAALGGAGSLVNVIASIVWALH